MAGAPKEPGPTARRVAEAVRRFRREEPQDITTAELSRRLTELGQPIPDTSITKTEQGTRRVDVDDLVAIALALGVTPNTLLMPPVEHLGAAEWHRLTPAVLGTAESLWQWAQGEKPLPFRAGVPGSDSWLGDSEHRDIEFSIRCRPYLTALHQSGNGADPRRVKLGIAVLEAMEAGIRSVDIRRIVETTLMTPAVMPAGQALRQEREAL
jgi:hypothetical protein